MFSWTSYLLLTVVGFVFVVYEDLFVNSIQNRQDGSLSPAERLEIGLDSAITAIILVKYFLNFCCGSKVSFGYQILWVVCEIVVV
jgi:hypothetical protein